MGLRFKNANIIGMVLIMKLKNLLLLLGVVTICSSCIGDSTDTGNPTISATTTGVCQPMLASTCQITLTYNTGGQSGLILGYQANPNLSIFNISTGSTGSNGLNNCSVGNLTGNQQCSITVGYCLLGSCTLGNSESVYFTLGNGSANVNSNTISIGN